jgi:hypothetical protein
MSFSVQMNGKFQKQAEGSRWELIEDGVLRVTSPDGTVRVFSPAHWEIVLDHAK